MTPNDHQHKGDLSESNGGSNITFGLSELEKPAILNLSEIHTGAMSGIPVGAG